MIRDCAAARNRREVALVQCGAKPLSGMLMKRRDFLELGAALAAAGSAHASVDSGAPLRMAASSGPTRAMGVDFLHDGRSLTPTAYAQLLMRLADEGRIKPDFYSNGGVVEELERRFAKALGQEAAAFMPTGTLANHLAVRRLSGSSRRVIVPAESHLYRDSGDCAQTLSHLNLIPLGVNQMCYGLDELIDTIQRSDDARVSIPVGALTIETPVRRFDSRAVRYENLAALVDAAHKRGIKAHLDGARIFIQSVHADTAPAAFGQMFDTVYTSLWKCFNAPSGAVLAGSKTVIDGIFHERRMFGGGLPSAWPFAAVALHFADSFLEEYRAALKRARALGASLTSHGAELADLEDGTHIVRLTVNPQIDPQRFHEALARREVHIPESKEGTFYLKINPTLNDAPDLEIRFVDALREAA
jgi:threonine aldolase